MKKNKVVVTNSRKNLTSRQSEVMELICQGLKANEIAERLIIAPATVKTHIINIFNTLGVNSRAEAVVKFLEYKKGVIMTPFDCRINFATSITNEALKNPELAVGFINIVASECSRVELERIRQRFFELTKTISNKWNLEN